MDSLTPDLKAPALSRVTTAHTYASGADAAIDALAEQLGEGAALIAYFCSPVYDGAAIGAGLAQRYSDASVIGCTTAGEFTERVTSTGAVCAIAIPAAKVVRSASVLARFDDGVDSGMADGLARLEQELGESLRDLDPARYVGLLLIEGLQGHEERVNELLGNAAPLMSFVGGSAGDDLAFEGTRVFLGDEYSDAGAVLTVLELGVPFVVTKTCAFEPTGTVFQVTKTNAEERTVLELNGRPAVDAYADALGLTRDQIDANVFMEYPLGLMCGAEAWIRSPKQVVEDGGIQFFCQVLEGMRLDLVRSTDMVAETRMALARAGAELGGLASGALLFNCILRRLEMDAKGLEDGFVAAVSGYPAAGFHTYGESWLGHCNQTLTGLVIG